jgi:hypothetical protein
MPLASTSLTPFCLISESYTRQLLHKPNFTPTSFYASTLLHQALFPEGHPPPPPAFTQTHFYKPPFPQTTFYTNQLFQQRAFAHTSFYTNQLLDKPPFTQTTFYINQLCTSPALGLQAKGQRAGGMPKAV